MTFSMVSYFDLMAIVSIGIAQFLWSISRLLTLPISYSKRLFVRSTSQSIVCGRYDQFEFYAFFFFHFHLITWNIQLNHRYFPSKPFEIVPFSTFLWFSIAELINLCKPKHRNGRFRPANMCICVCVNIFLGHKDFFPHLVIVRIPFNPIDRF